MYTMGVDVGSASSKVVILKDGKDVVAAEVVQVGTGSSGPQRALEQAYKVSGLTREDISYLVVPAMADSLLKALTNRSAKSAAMQKVFIT